ncbi:hypothetical protein [Nocardia asteroides]|uniref:hypothetical protein n=1 Tax=Nocardia asteroides TaxID=1824 RepID=UPI001E6599B4|nr:hypothetical protein [Nocardia asteroides]UGT62689.1 hypothetical protein LTT61_04920 [Nocardia asteroides]
MALDLHLSWVGLRTYAPLLVYRDDGRVLAHVGTEEVARLLELVGVCQEQPVEVMTSAKPSASGGSSACSVVRHAGVDTGPFRDRCSAVRHAG